MVKAINLAPGHTARSIEITGTGYLTRKRKRRARMLIKIQVSEQEVQLIIDALAEHGKPLVNKPKQNSEEKRKLRSIENIIHQLWLGNQK